jgi:hypothetical protein
MHLLTATVPNTILQEDADARQEILSSSTTLVGNSAEPAAFSQDGEHDSNQRVSPLGDGVTAAASHNAAVAASLARWGEMATGVLRSEAILDSNVAGVS